MHWKPSSRTLVASSFFSLSPFCTLSCVSSNRIFDILESSSKHSYTQSTLENLLHFYRSSNWRILFASLTVERRFSMFFFINSLSLSLYLLNTAKMKINNEKKYHTQFFFSKSLSLSLSYLSLSLWDTIWYGIIWWLNLVWNRHHTHTHIMFRRLTRSMSKSLTSSSLKSSKSRKMTSKTTTTRKRRVKTTSKITSKRTKTTKTKTFKPPYVNTYHL